VLIAGLFDIHGNLPALDAVLTEVERAGVDLIVIGGDIASGPMPAETLDRLLELGSRVHYVRGNADRELVNARESWTAGVPPPSELTSREPAREWEAPRLRPRHRELLASFELSLSEAVHGLGEVLFCHASPRSDEEIITSLTTDELLTQALAGTSARVIVAGHTHVQLDRRIGRQRFVNAGSVGMPYEDDPGAYWVLVGEDVSLLRTSYDYAGAADLIRATGHPEAEDMVRECLLEPIGSAEATRHFDAIARTRRPPPPSI